MPDEIELLGQAEEGIGRFVASHAMVDAVRTHWVLNPID